MADRRKASKRGTLNHCEFSEADRAPFFEMARRFSQRLKHEPDRMTDGEIRDVLGEEVAPAKVRRFAASSPIGYLPKQAAPRGLEARSPEGTVPEKVPGTKTSTAEAGKRLRKKANRALHTRLFALGRVLDEVDAAIAGVIAAPGRTNRLSELEFMLQQIESFRNAVGWPRDNAEPLPHIDPEIFKDLLLDPDWTPGKK